MFKKRKIVYQYRIFTVSQGFTLIETMITTTILMAVVATVFLLQHFFYTQQNMAFNSFASVENANAGVEQMVKEIRNARYGDDGSYPLQTCTDQNLTIFSDIDYDGITEKVQYFLDSSTLKKAVTKPSAYPINYDGSAIIYVMAEGIVNDILPIFKYYDSDYNGESDPLDLNQRQLQTRLIKIELISNQVNDSSDKSDYTITGNAQIRMLKNNL